MARTPIPEPALRRIRREARSAAFRERALALHQAGWTLADIGQALGVGSTRAFQILRKAKRLAAESQEAAPVLGAASRNSHDPLPTGRIQDDAPCLYRPPGN
jgi:hypothetical protein